MSLWFFLYVCVGESERVIYIYIIASSIFVLTISQGISVITFYLDVDLYIDLYFFSINFLGRLISIPDIICIGTLFVLNFSIYLGFLWGKVVSNLRRIWLQISAR